MNKTSDSRPFSGGPDRDAPDPPPAGGSASGAKTVASRGDGRATALDADLGELILLIGRIRRDLDGGDPLHCPDMKPLSRRADRIVGLLPQLPRDEAQPLLPRLERVMRELDAVEGTLRQRKADLDRSLDQVQSPGRAPEGRHGR